MTTFGITKRCHWNCTVAVLHANPHIYNLRLYHPVIKLAWRQTITSHSVSRYSRVVSTSRQRAPSCMLSPLSFTDNANQPASTRSVRSSMSGDTIILPSSSTPIDLQVPRRVATRSHTGEIYMPVPRMSLEAVSFNRTAPLEEHRPQRSPLICK